MELQMSCSICTEIQKKSNIQRPDSTIISGQIKNNVSYRVCGRFVDKELSRIMLGSDRANTLPNIKGRFIVKDNVLEEVQSFYFSGESLNNLCSYAKIKSDPIDNNYDVSNGDLSSDQMLNEKEKHAEVINISDSIHFDFRDVEK